MAEKENYTNSNNAGFNPQYGTEALKFFQNFKLPGFDAESMTQSYRKNMQALELLQQTTLETAKSIAQAQSQFVRQAMEDGSNLLRRLMTSGNNVEEKFDLHSQTLQDNIQKALLHNQEISGILNNSHQKAVNLASTRLNEYMQEVNTLAKKTARKA